MEPLLRETGIYILPSQVEPWGVSVHEMAVAGFPMLLSDAVGAREAFLVEGQNGAVFQSRNSASLLEKMQWIASLDQGQLLTMSEHSHTLGMQNTPEIWASTLLSILK